MPSSRPLRNGWATGTPPGPSCAAHDAGRCVGEEPALPARHRDLGAVRAAADREVVHQPPRARQPEPERAAASRRRRAARRRRPAMPGPASRTVIRSPRRPARSAGASRTSPSRAYLDRVARDLRDRGGDVLRLDARQPARLARARAPRAPPRPRRPRRRAGASGPRSSPREVAHDDDERVVGVLARARRGSRSASSCAEPPRAIAWAKPESIPSVASTITSPAASSALVTRIDGRL